MKKTILFSTVLLFSINIMMAQDNYLNLLPKDWYTTMFITGELNKANDRNIEGTPYNNLLFYAANISGINLDIKVRYNEESDQVEFQDKDARIFIIPKDPKHNSIFIKELKYKLRLVDYINNTNKPINGYLVEISKKNKISLLRRDRIIVKPEKQPKNSYYNYEAAKFIKANKEYYIELSDNTVISMPKSKKQLQDLFPNQKESIINFFKVNNYSFKEETDLINIVNFIATL